MAQAPRDQNYVPTILLEDDTTGATQPGQRSNTSSGMLVHIVGSDVPIDEKEATGFNGAPVTVGTTAVEMTFTGTTQSIAIQSANTNTGYIWFGGATIDNTGANAIGSLTAGQSVTLELNDAAAAVYAVSDTAAQTVYKAALT